MTKTTKPKNTTPKKVSVKERIAAKRKEVEETVEDAEDIEEAAAGVGHNGGPRVGGIAGDQLRSFIDRIERLEEEKKGLMEDIKEVFAGAKAVGFDTKIMRKVIGRRKMDKSARQEEEALIDVYEHALGD